MSKPSMRLLALAVAFTTALSGCAAMKSSTPDVGHLKDGPGLEFDSAALGTFRKNQDAVLVQLYAMAGVASPPAAANDWERVINAGMDYADSRCEAYMHALFRLNRNKKTTTSQIGLLGTAAAGLMAAAESAAKEVAAVAVLFGLAGASVDNFGGNVLYDLDPSSVRTLVKSLQSRYRSSLLPGYDSRPAALRVIRAYAMLCVPANIEAEVNLAVKSSTPFANEGHPETGQPPEVSNSETAVSPFKAKLDDNTALLRSFVFPNGRLNAANRSALEKYLQDNKIMTDVSSFMRLERFASARADAVKKLNLK